MKWLFPHTKKWWGDRAKLDACLFRMSDLLSFRIFVWHLPPKHRAVVGIAQLEVVVAAAPRVPE